MIVRIIAIVFTALVAATILFVTIVFTLAYRFSPMETQELEVEGLTSEVRIGWPESGIAMIDAENELDAVTALGYCHAAQSGWSMVLWRQVAFGRLSEWFGDSTAVLDTHARQIGFSSKGRAAYDTLQPIEKAFLVAYANGVNAVLSQHPSHYPQDLLLSGVMPEKWEPWHSLAVEKLVLWLASTQKRDVPANESLIAFDRVDDQLKDFLKVGGFDMNLAWTARAPTDIYFFQRHVYGETANPLLQSIVIRNGASRTFVGSIPGTLMLPAGINSVFGWHVSIAGTRDIGVQPAISEDRIPSFDSFRNKEGDEFLVSFYRNEEELLLPDSRVVGDSLSEFTWAISWDGFRNVSDIPSWISLLQSEVDFSFQQIDGDGIIVRRDGQWQITGSPGYVENLPNGVLIGESHWVTTVADELRNNLELLTEMAPILENKGGFHSDWAANEAPPLIERVASLDNNSVIVEDAIAFLENWDFTFTPSSIGASIFDTWMSRYLDSRLPHLSYTTAAGNPVSDSLRIAQETTRLQDTLDEAVREIRNRLGPDMSLWRWETIQPDTLKFPVWSEPALRRHLDARSPSKFSSTSNASGGHPTTLFWRSSNVTGGRKAPAAWQAWTNSSSWENVHLIFAELRDSSFLERYLHPSAQREETIDVDIKLETEVTILLPSSGSDDE